MIGIGWKFRVFYTAPALTHLLKVATSEFRHDVQHKKTRKCANDGEKNLMTLIGYVFFKEFVYTPFLVGVVSITEI